jgi:hypothetical protein
MNEPLVFPLKFRLMSSPGGVWLEIRPAFRNYYCGRFTPSESRQFSEKILFCAATAERSRGTAGDSHWSRDEFSWLWLSSGPAVGVAFRGSSYLRLVVWRQRRYEITISLDEALELACQLYLRGDKGRC